MTLPIGIIPCSRLMKQGRIFLQLLQNKTTFQFTCPVASDSTDVTQTITRTCYCSNYGAALQRLKAGVWRDMDLEIKEC